jgi:hypothetical protein
MFLAKQLHENFCKKNEMCRANESFAYFIILLFIFLRCKDVRMIATMYQAFPESEKLIDVKGLPVKNLIFH